jgi:uncharacterized protein (TIRG00374 family)
MNADSRPAKKSVFGTVAWYVVAAAALFWVFHDVNISVLKRDFAHVNWLLAFAGMTVDIGRYVTQSLRWSLLLRPVGRISFGRTFQALYAGIFCNLILPLRLGEIARAHLASRYAQASFPSVMSSLMCEYLIDGVWMAVGIGAVALAVPLPREVADTARILGAAVLCAAALFVYFVIKTQGVAGTENRAAWKPLRLLFSFVVTMRRSLQLIGRSRFFWPAFAVSAFDILFHIVAFWIVLIAYGIQIPPVPAAAVLLFIFVGLIIPNAPSNVGSFQFLCVVGLLAFGVDKTAASGFSVLFFVLVNIPQVVIGWIMFSRSGHTLYDLKDRLTALRLSMKEQP